MQQQRDLRLAGALIGSAAVATVIGAGLTGVMKATSDVPDELWRAPWSEGEFRVFVAYTVVTHGLVVAGLLLLRGSGWLPERAAIRRGLGAVVGGTLLLAIAEVCSLSVANANASDEGMWVGALYGISSVLLAVGMIVAGISARRPEAGSPATSALLICGVLSVPTIVLGPTSLTWLAVAIYGVGYVVLAAALLGAGRALAPAETDAVPELRARSAS